MFYLKKNSFLENIFLLFTEIALFSKMFNISPKTKVNIKIGCDGKSIIFCISFRFLNYQVP